MAKVKHAEVSFEVDARSALLIRKIVNRAMGLSAEHHFGWDRMSVSMDITATHANGCPLRLKDLLEADNFNFLHDVGGIRRHLNRDTGKLGDFFSPRFSRPERKSAA